MDLSRVDIIRQATLETFESAERIENFMPLLGFNDEIGSEQPAIVHANTGGLRIWQYPNQFSKYLMFIKQFRASSYIEIGCRWGGTFIFTTEFLKRFGTVTESVAVDIFDSPVADYCALNPETKFLKMNSTGPEFKEFISTRVFDIVFIDGDHSYSGVKADFETTRNSGKIFVFHDISSDACPGVVQFWNELKTLEGFSCIEFTEQYPDVNGNFLGIGVAINKQVV